MTKIKELLAQLCPNGVEWKELGEVFDIIAGGDVPRNNYSKERTERFNIPILSNGINDKSLYGWTNISKINVPALTISARGTIGWPSYQEKPFFPIVRLLVLIPTIEINLKFVYHLLKLNEHNYDIPKTGIPQLTKPMLSKIKIPIPPLKIQQEIVQILDKFTDYITELTAELTAELTDRKKQYSFYRDKLLSFSDEVYQVEWKTLGEVLNKGRGTKITAGQMKELHKEGAPIRIFAGGKTFADVDYGDIPDKDVHEEVGIVVKSRGIIEFEYCTRPFSFKNEFWSYSSDSELVDLKYVYYFLNQNKEHFQTIANNMQMPQISSRDTENFKIPIPSLAIQERIVHVLDNFDTVCNDLNIGLPKEIELRQKQYEYFRDQLLTFDEKCGKPRLAETMPTDS